jgi:hypothetical protein
MNLIIWHCWFEPWFYEVMKSWLWYSLTRLLLCHLMMMFLKVENYHEWLGDAQCTQISIVLIYSQHWWPIFWGTFLPDKDEWCSQTLLTNPQKCPMNWFSFISQHLRPSAMAPKHSTPRPFWSQCGQSSHAPFGPLADPKYHWRKMFLLNTHTSNGEHLKGDQILNEMVTKPKTKSNPKCKWFLCKDIAGPSIPPPATSS